MAVYAAIMKAKVVLSEAKHLGILPNKDDAMGEVVKTKRPNKNPKEEKLGNPVAKDDANSGYGHVGSKHYIGKSYDDAIIKAVNEVIKELGNPDDMHEEDKQLSEKLHELTLLLPTLTGDTHAQAVKEMRDIIDMMMQGRGAPGDTGPGQGPPDDPGNPPPGIEQTWKSVLQEARK